MAQEIKLRYGCNPHQTPSRIYIPERQLPVRVLNGAPGYINFLDALNSWQLVRELRAASGLPAATSFKHVSPAGAALAVALSDAEAKACLVEDIALSPLAAAYARARGADRMSSFGDFAALSDVVDVATATILHREVSDGVIAPGYEPGALELLKKKKGGAYNVMRIDAAYEPPRQERREVFGVSFEQRRNDAAIGPDTLRTIVTRQRELPETARRDLILAQIALKYTQSNSVIFAHGGQVTGTGAGQQSRVHCTRLAGAKSDRWFLRQHPRVLALPFVKGMKRAEMNNAIDLFLEDSLSDAEQAAWERCFEQVPEGLSVAEKRAWLDALSGVCVASDAFFPFRDNIDCARQSGVSYVVQPGGSVRDEDVIAACDEYGMVMALSGLRLFHH